MAIIKLIFASTCLAIAFKEISGHGRMLDPVSRSSAWKSGFGTPANYDENELFCGGASVQQNNGGRCGTCGDSFSDPIPRNNENGGKYGTGKIVKTYNEGQRATIHIELTANHKGHFEFAVCPLNGPNDVETEECFAQHPVKLTNGKTKYEVLSGINSFNIDVILPQGLTCQHCSFRWHYRGGNNWGVCDPKTGEGRLGCGPQETFRNCADISIS